MKTVIKLTVERLENHKLVETDAFQFPTMPAAKEALFRCLTLAEQTEFNSMWSDEPHQVFYRDEGNDETFYVIECFYCGHRPRRSRR